MCFYRKGVSVLVYWVYVLTRRVVKVKQSMLIVYIASAFLIIIGLFVGGSNLVFEGLKISLNTAIKSAIMLLASFVIIGQLNVLLTSDLIKKWLERFEGIKAIIVSAIAGGLFPGGPYIYYPFIMSFKDKNLPSYILISFIFGKQVYDFSRLPMESSFMGIDITLMRNIITLPIPIVVGILAKRFLKSVDIYNLNLKAGEKIGSNNNYP